MTSRNLPGLPLVLAILITFWPAPSHADSSGAAIAIVPGDEWMDNGQTIAYSQHLRPDAIYIYHKGAEDPDLILYRQGTPSSPQLSNDGKLLAYCYLVPTASGIRGVGASHVPWVIISNSTGTPIDSVLGGSYSAWSATSESLLVLVPKGRNQDSVVIWNSKTKSKDRYAAASVIARNGWTAAARFPNGHQFFPKNVKHSPDGAYWTLAEPYGDTHVVEDSSRAELTQAVHQAVGDTNLIRMGRVCWMPAKRGHVLALSVQDKVYYEPKQWRIQSRVALVDVGWPRLVGSVPGMLAGLSADRRYLVVAKAGKVVFVPCESIHWQETGSGAESQVKIEVSASEWGRGGETRLGGTTVELAVGERFGLKPEWLGVGWKELVGGGFRLIRADKDGSALIEADPCLIPSTGEDTNGPLKQRLLISRWPFSLGSCSDDAGIIVHVRTLGD